MSFEARLCREILEEEFGPFVAKVSHQLLLRGRMTLFDVTRFTQLPQRQVRECLVVLIQHGLAYFTESLDGKKEPTYYQVDPRRVLLRLRMASIMRVTEDTFGKEVHSQSTSHGA
ncbi:uncharacterized protein BYT42DRAFT_56363 [Radiomyces spectabilis]|uniref:uncharacterized protein n=1 Tax=Radiomyces spectabilis TaxID=64574 RepID=UPI00221FABF7|nr:uncharacterized protein BYT42DRAFT_56363 [Radiomyces spectabilis]KAI8373042.1 hypothetical protein BYT42DRAFT_56363 [Radiomyces spectabilis]